MMGLLPDKYHCGLRMRRESPECFPRHRLQRKPLVSDPGMHHRTCETHIGNAYLRWRENPQFYVSGKRSMKSHLRSLWKSNANRIWFFQDFEQVALLCFRSTTSCFIVSPNGMRLKSKRQIICQSVIEALWCYGLIQLGTWHIATPVFTLSRKWKALIYMAPLLYFGQSTYLTLNICL